MAVVPGSCYAQTMAKRFDNKVVWITGGGSGIGRALASAFAKEGAIVAVSGRREERLREVVEELEAKGAKGLAVRCDVTDEASVAEAVRKVVRTLGGLDVAIANAGFAVAGRIEKLSAADWQDPGLTTIQLRLAGNPDVVAIANTGTEPVEIALPPGDWRLVVDTAAPRAEGRALGTSVVAESFAFLVAIDA